MISPSSTEHRGTVEQIHQLIHAVQNDASHELTQALLSLSKDPDLVAWHDQIALAMANQTRHRRETQFRYPIIAQVLRTLAGGRPANAADLQAAMLEHLRVLGSELSHGSTDGYKAFWNVDSHGRPTKPRPEDDCRDRLLERLRPSLVSMEVNGEPEGHYADDKRSDIKALCGNLNLPVEIKQHYHKDLWTAPTEQLGKLYVRDPGTQGRGIYLVFWFGTNVKPVPKPPEGISRPLTPTDLENALRGVIPDDDRLLIEVIVVDVARPT